MSDPTMGRCKDCEWWAEEPAWPRGAPNPVYEMRGECMRQYEKHKAEGKNFISAGDLCSYEAPIYTGPEFGCILFSDVRRKETPDE